MLVLPHYACQWLILTPYWLPGSLWTLTGKMGGWFFSLFGLKRVEIFTEDGHFLAISLFIIVTGLKPHNKKQFGVRLYRQFWEKFIDMSQKFMDEYRECQ